MVPYNHPDDLDQALKELDVKWGPKRKQQVHDQMINEVRNMNQKGSANRWMRLAANVALILVVAFGVYYYVLDGPGGQQAGPPDSTPVGTQADSGERGELKEVNEEELVKTVVEGFGKKLQHVSVLAPSDSVKESIQEHYSEFVTPELLNRWLDDPSSAPGRLTSSPWPERIEILAMEEVEEDVYEVQGEVLEVTSAGDAEENVVSRIPIKLTVKKVDDQWLINDVVLDGEAGDSTTYENMEYGFKVVLPESWSGYAIIQEEWVGNDISGEGKTTDSVKGPLVIIRHPEWTEKEPRQDIPIMIFTHEQWALIEEAKLAVSAAPIPPRELGRNEDYVFALPPRYNYEFPTGYEEVEQIIESGAFQAID